MVEVVEVQVVEVEMGVAEAFLVEESRTVDFEACLAFLVGEFGVKEADVADLVVVLVEASRREVEALNRGQVAVVVVYQGQEEVLAGRSSGPGAGS